MIFCGIFVPHLKKLRSMKKTFAHFIREKRINAGLTLREFCRQSGFDASNWSKIERSLIKPPQSKNVLDMIAEKLNIKKGSQEYKEMCDLAALSSIPEGLIEPEIMEQLPIFFRTVRGEKPNEKELISLVTKIKSAWTPET